MKILQHFIAGQTFLKILPFSQQQWNGANQIEVEEKEGLHLYCLLEILY